MAIPVHQGTHPVTTSTKAKCQDVGDDYNVLSVIVAALCRSRARAACRFLQRRDAHSFGYPEHDDPRKQMISVKVRTLEHMLCQKRQATKRY